MKLRILVINFLLFFCNNINAQNWDETEKVFLDNLGTNQIDIAKNELTKLEKLTKQQFKDTSFQTCKLNYYKGQIQFIQGNDEQAINSLLNSKKYYVDPAKKECGLYHGILNLLMKLYYFNEDYIKAYDLGFELIQLENNCRFLGNYEYTLAVKTYANICLEIPEKEEVGLNIIFNLGSVYNDVIPKLELGSTIKSDVLKSTSDDLHFAFQAFHDKALTSLKKNNLEKVEKYLNIALKINKQYFSTILSWTNGEIRDKFWNRDSSFYNLINDYAANQANNYNSFNIIAFNSNLISRSFLLEAKHEVDKVISKSKDTLVINANNELKTLRKYITKNSSRIISDSNYLKEIEKKATSIENILIQRIDVYSQLMDKYEKDFTNVIISLEKNASAIEYIRFTDIRDGEYWYAAMLAKKDSKYPTLIKLCKEEELKQYNPEGELNLLYNILWKPLLPYLEGSKTIYYSPAGLLNNIPFQALFKEENGKIEYVMDKYDLHQLTSTRYLALDLKKKEQESIGNSIALFGGINYNDYPNASIDEINKEESLNAAVMYKYAIASKRGSDNDRSGVKYLHGTKTEVNNITHLLKNKNWNVELLEGINASENKIKSFSGNNSKNILHIATHGFAFPDREDNIKSSPLDMIKGSDRFQAAENPMIRSGLYFAGANLTLKDKGDSLINKTNEDGVLTAYELAEMDLSNTKLAVLSACETGKGVIQGSEGTFGLKRALKLAGVDNMIVSLWKVPDVATSEMMTLFYTELAKTKKPVSSFETAQKAMRFKYPNEPKMWAGFVFVR